MKSYTIKDKNGKRILKDAMVLVPEPNGTDIHSHSFEGTAIQLRNNNVIVEDSEGDCFEIEPYRLEVIESEFNHMEELYGNEPEQD